VLSACEYVHLETKSDMVHAPALVINAQIAESQLGYITTPHSQHRGSLCFVQRFISVFNIDCLMLKHIFLASTAINALRYTHISYFTRILPYGRSQITE